MRTIVPGLKHRFGRSYQASDIKELITYLLHHGYTHVKRLDHEHARLICGAALAVIHLSGAVVPQGRDPTPLIALLDAAVEPEPFVQHTLW